MIFAALFLLAQAPDAVPECADPTTQGEMNACAKQEFDRVDAELNAVWKKVRGWAKKADAKLDGGDGQSGYAESLLAAQRETLARGNASLDRALDVLIPSEPTGLYGASGKAERRSSSGGSFQA